MEFIGAFCWFMGFVGAVSFAVNLLPNLVHALKVKETGLPYGFFVLAFLGNIGSAILVFWTNLQTGVWQWPLYGNYAVAFTLSLWLFILRIRYRK